MLLSDKYCISGIIFDSMDQGITHPRKRIAVRFPNMNTTRGVDILPSTKNNPGQLRKAACVELGISMDQIYVSEKLKRIIEGP